MTTDSFTIISHVDAPRGLAVIDVTNWGEFFYINRILVPLAHRNQGIGSSMMETLCARADVLDMILAVDPTANYGSDVPRLTAFFERYGFVRTDPEDPDMPRLIRRPRGYHAQTV